MRISDWSSDVCSSDLQQLLQKFAGPCAGQIYRRHVGNIEHAGRLAHGMVFVELGGVLDRHVPAGKVDELGAEADVFCVQSGFLERHDNSRFERSEEHTSELQSLMRISYAVFCLKKKKKQTKII